MLSVCLEYSPLCQLKGHPLSWSMALCPRLWAESVFGGCPYWNRTCFPVTPGEGVSASGFWNQLYHQQPGSSCAFRPFCEEGEERLVLRQGLFCFVFCFLKALKRRVIYCNVIKTFLHLFDFGSRPVISFSWKMPSKGVGGWKGRAGWQVMIQVLVDIMH